ncbi:DUF4189 domain-containing protein [Neisseria subflava]|jgi:hypothetical protein|uniref:DUF4189 domain-containing protein n=1 Tax=Neisseria subflava TaxID=28449 RepID=UPI0024B1DB07|nr:DUF4189 domain-containing protein [Neisseria subflava]
MKKLLVILLGLTSLNIYAADPVTRGALQNNPALCQYGYNPNCASSRQRQQKQPTEIVNIDVPSKYGAWAVNLKTGISADTVNAPSLEVAKKGAIKACEQGGQNAPCVVGAWVRNGCIAVAQGKTGKKLKTFYGIEAPGQAEPSALRKCRASGGVQCKITTPEGCSMPKF